MAGSSKCPFSGGPSIMIRPPNNAVAFNQILPRASVALEFRFVARGPTPRMIRRKLFYQDRSCAAHTGFRSRLSFLAHWPSLSQNPSIFEPKTLVQHS
jgi:hypothetical protein